MAQIISSSDLEKIIELRKTIHSNPELAHQEYETAKTVVKFIGDKPDEIITGIGGTGVAMVFNGAERGKTVLIRADLDALPIKEINNFTHKSLNENVSHKCGHDGHTAILAGLAVVLSKSKIKNGRVVLLFQPAEEIGEGAAEVLQDEKFGAIEPDYVFALHNLPGYEKGTIINRHGTFASASKGMIIRLTGKTSHAAEPENGQSPASAMTKVISRLNNLIEFPGNKLNDFSLVTVIHARLGDRAFGTSPGYAEVMATLRSYRDDDMEKITEEAERIINLISEEEKIKIDFEYTEQFPSTVNDEYCVGLIKEIAENKGLAVVEKEKPFKWSEDFGHLTSKYRGALFGLGSGIDTPQLHNPDYDFPDEIIETGIDFYHSIIKNLLDK